MTTLEYTNSYIFYDKTINDELCEANIYFSSKINELRIANVKYNSYVELVNKFIDNLNQDKEDVEIISNMISYTNLKRDFFHVFIIKFKKTYIWFSIRINKFNYTKDFFNCQSSFTTTNKLPEFLLNNDKINQNVTELHYHNSIIDYIKNKDSITLKEILSCKGITLDETYEIELEKYVDTIIENEETIIDNNNQMHKIYKWELTGTLSELVCEYCKNSNEDGKNYTKKRRYSH